MKKTITIITAAVVAIASISTASAQCSSRPAGPGLVGPPLVVPLTAPRPIVVAPVVQQPVAPVAPAVVRPPVYVAPAPPIQPPVETRPVVNPVSSFVLPATCAFLTKLEFHGQIVNQGMQVVSLNYGGLAQRLGLVPGDIIASINGEQIHCERDYDEALFRAAVYGGGNITLQVRNVRWTPGCRHAQQFVTFVTQLPKRAVVAPVAANSIVAAR